MYVQFTSCVCREAFDMSKKTDLISSLDLASKDWKILCVIESSWFRFILMIQKQPPEVFFVKSYS